MRFRVELRRQACEQSPRIMDATDVTAIDAIDAAEIARQRIADRYDDPACVWTVLSVNPLEPLNVT